jgi:TonB family protein
LCFVGQGSLFAQNLEQPVVTPYCEKPSYPSASKRLNEEGTVQLKFFVGTDGRVIDSSVEKSSGFRRLDDAARQSLSKCTFKPGTKDGVAVESWASMKYTWKLNVFTPCVGGDVTKWKSCLGTLPTSTGGISVVEYEAGKKSGRGIEYDPTGNVIRAGIFEDENLVSERTLDVKLYPFIAQLPANSANQPINSAVIQPNISSSNLPACQGIDVSSWTNCFGTQSYVKGHSYVGEFKDGMFEGQGTEYFVSGFKYVGQYKSGKRSGQGIHYKLDGSILQSGSWLNDVLVKPIELEKPLLPFNTPTQFAISNSPSTTERDRLNAEVDAERKKRQELEEQLRVAQQQAANPIATYGIERRVALVIGNATYKVNPLKNPVNDSTDMARSLRSVGFDVIEANNTTLAQMREATRRFADKLGNSDVGLVYYSGHGVEVKGKNYLIPVNADIRREYEVVDQAFDASQFLEMMDNIRGPNNKRVNILIVDACRNNELQRSWRSTNNGLARMDAPGGTFISFATAPGRVAADGVGRNSPYTKHLLQALKQPNVPIEQVFKVVRRNVMEETKGEQIPWENSSLVGDFYFTVQR